MKNNVYVIYDVVSDSTVVIGTSATDGAFVRQNVPYLSKINDNFLNDFVIYRIGEYFDSECRLVPCEKVLVDWSSYKKPEVEK